MLTRERAKQAAKSVATESERSPKRVFYGWWVLLGSGVGLALCFGPIIVSTFGVFVKPLTREFGWSRGEISMAFSVAMVAHTATMPFIGRLADYVRARKVILAATILFGLGVFGLAFLSKHLWQFYVIYLIIGVAGAGNGPVPYAKVITRWFDRKRGFALGLAMAVVSASVAILPFVAQGLVSTIGWRSTYAVMALAIIGITIPAVGLLLKESPHSLGLLPDGAAVDLETSRVPIEEETGLSFHESWHASSFWLIVAAFFLMSVSFFGLIVHLVPMLTDRGISARNAALAASLVGCGGFMARIGIGYVLDIFFAASVAALMFTASTLGFCILLVPTAGLLPFLAAFLIGIGQGAELDIIPYMASRYFGLVAFAEIYGYLFAVFTFGGVVGPVLMGKAFDALGSYRLMLGVFAVATLVASALMTRLGPYRSTQLVAQPA
jgi:MFS family permease